MSIVITFRLLGHCDSWFVVVGFTSLEKCLLDVQLVLECQNSEVVFVAAAVVVLVLVVVLANTFPLLPCVCLLPRLLYLQIREI